MKTINKNKGFTLIELMVTLVIIMSMSFLAVPAFQDLSIKAQVAKGVSQASTSILDIQEYHAVHGEMPSFSTNLTNSDYVSEIKVEEGEIKIIFNGHKSHEKLKDRVLTYSPSYKDGKVEWSCSMNDYQFLPKNCEPKKQDSIEVEVKAIFPELQDKNFSHYEIQNYQPEYNYLSLNIINKQDEVAGQRNITYTQEGDSLELLTDINYKNKSHTEIVFVSTLEFESLLSKINNE